MLTLRFAFSPLLFLPLLACGDVAGARSDAAIQPSHDAAADTHDTHDAATAPHDAAVPPSAACPASVPTQGTSCSHDGVQCEYGSDPEPSCNPQAQCLSGVWGVQPAAPASACVTANATGCPASFSGLTPSAACDEAATQAAQANGVDALSCYYPEARCTCTNSCECELQPQPDASLPFLWRCDTPTTSSCPVPRPRYGSSCGAPGSTCTYGACPDITPLECSDAGVWQPGLVGCPK